MSLRALGDTWSFQPLLDKPPVTFCQYVPADHQRRERKQNRHNHDTWRKAMITEGRVHMENDYNNPHKCHRLLKGFSEVNEHMVPRTVPGTQ